MIQIAEEEYKTCQWCPKDTKSGILQSSKTRAFLQQTISLALNLQTRYTLKKTEDNKL